MKYVKLPLIYADQFDLLVARGLECGDRDRALAWLCRIGYYRLSAYFIPFRISGTDNFFAGTTFDQIVNLYKFDSGLRLLTMHAIDRIEVAVRAAVTYELAHTLGVFGHTDPLNFAISFDHAAFLGLIRREETRSSQTFVGHYRSKYTSETHLPVWMATELISFRALSKMYANLRAKLQKQIAHRFNQPAPVFVSWLHALVAIRNDCAHHSRLWNKELAVKPELPNAWKAQGIGNWRFYMMALIIQTLLQEISPRSRWQKRLKAHIAAYPAVAFAQMHFPLAWSEDAPRIKPPLRD